MVSAREDVVIETIVPSADVGQTGQGGGVRLMVGGAAAEFRPAVDSPRHQIVRIGAALRPIPQVDGRQEQVVVRQERPVIHLDEQVVGAVVVTQAAADAGPLAVEDGVVAHDMGADLLAGPPRLERTHMRNPRTVR